MKTVTLLLAGGESSRMQQDKSLLILDGVPLIRRVYEVASKCTTEVYVLTPWPDKYQHVLPIHCRWLIEESPHQGPLLAFQQSLLHVTADWVLLLACDLPYLDTVVIQEWVRELENVPREAIAYLAPQVKGWEALCGFYRGTCRPSLDTFIQAGGRSFQQWLRTEIVTPITVTTPQIFTNWNYPEDIQT